MVRGSTEIRKLAAQIEVRRDSGSDLLDDYSRPPDFRWAGAIAGLQLSRLFGLCRFPGIAYRRIQSPIPGSSGLLIVESRHPKKPKPYDIRQAPA